MKASQPENIKQSLRRFVRRQQRRHDPMLVLDMFSFNSTDGWKRTVSKHEYVRSFA